VDTVWCISSTFTSDTGETVLVGVGCCSFCGVDDFGFFSGGCSIGAGVGDSLRLALMTTVGGNCVVVLDTFVSVMLMSGVLVLDSVVLLV